MLGLLNPSHPFYPRSSAGTSSGYRNYYNATFLYGLDFVSVGLTTRPPAAGYQEVIAEPQSRNYRKAILKNGVVVGALLLGNREQALAFKRAIDHRVNLAPVANRLFADDFSLDAWLDQHQTPGPVLNIHTTDRAGGYSSGAIDTPTLTLEDLEKEYILKVLNYTRWQKKKTSDILGINASTLYRKLIAYGVEKPAGLKGVEGTVGDSPEISDTPESEAHAA